MTTRQLFVGNKFEVQQFLTDQKPHYVYVLRKQDFIPFYVGKGQNGRVFNHEYEATRPRKDHKLNTIRKIINEGHSIIYEVDSVFDSHETALEREIELISSIGRRKYGGTLTNLTAGGEGTVDPSPEAKERHRQSLGGIPEDDPEKAILNEFFLSIGQPKSICVKIAKRFKIEPSKIYPERMGRKPTPRMAYALVASAVANGVAFEVGVEIPRRMTVDGISAVIENGVSRDLLTAGLAKLISSESPWEEAYLVTSTTRSYMNSVFSEDSLVKFGVVERK